MPTTVMVRYIAPILLISLLTTSCAPPVSRLNDVKYMTSLLADFRRYDSLLTLLQNELQDYQKQREPSGLETDPVPADLEGEFYILDDLAEVYTRGLVDFEKALETNSQALQRYTAIRERGLHKVPISPYFNSQRNLYLFFYPNTSTAELLAPSQPARRESEITFHRHEPPTGLFAYSSSSNPFGTVTYVTPYPPSVLEFVREDDLQRAKQRIDARFTFLNTKLGLVTPEIQKPPTGQESLTVTVDELNHLRTVLLSLDVYNSYYLNFYLAARAWHLYERDESEHHRSAISFHAAQALAAQSQHRLDADYKSLALLHLWAGIASFKSAENASGIQHFEEFNRAIENDDRLLADRFQQLASMRQALEEARERPKRIAQVTLATTVTVLVYAAAIAAIVLSAKGGSPYSEPSKLVDVSVNLLQSTGDAVSMLRTLAETPPPTGESVYYRSAYGLKLNRFFSKHEQVKLFYDLGRGFESDGRTPAAIEHYKEAITILEAQRESIMSEAQRIHFFQDAEAPYQRVIPLLIRENLLGAAFEYMERSRSRAFVELLGGKPLLFRLKDHTDAYTRILRTRSEIDAILDQRNVGVAQVRVVEDKLRDMQSTLPTASGDALEFRSLTTVQTADVESVGKLLGESVALVSYYLDYQGLSILLLQDGRLSGWTRPLTRKSLFEAITTFRGVLERPGRSTDETPEAGEAAAQAAGRTLYDLLWAPIAGSIRKPIVYIVPHGPLHYVPFSALHDGTGYLVDRHALATVPSATVLTFLANKATPSTIRGAIFANPSTKGDNIDLPFAEQEGLLVRDLLPDAQLFTGQNATETRVKAVTEAVGVLHFATHGVFNFERPLDSGLLLASDAQNDGVLTAREIFSLTIPGSLVVLSACQTGVSRVATGDELIGLTRALMYAGAKTIVSTLWNVNDPSTADLMRTFYEKLTVGSTAEALQASQRALKQQYPHPFYWAPFVLLGNYR